MSSFSFALYDAFSASAFGGSQAAVITGATAIDSAARQRIAREIGMPATAFVDGFGEDWIRVQFMSTVMELPMCGHGTLCLLTHMLEMGFLNVDKNAPREVSLRLPKSTSQRALPVTSSLEMSIDALSSALLSSMACLRMAQAPATCGAAKEVPLWRM